MSAQKLVLRNTLGFLQAREGLTYHSALIKIAKIIATGCHGDNPLFGQLLEADLPADPQKLHQLLAPIGGSVHA